MFFNIFRNKPRYVEVEAEGGQHGKKNKVLIIVIIIAILVLAFGNFGGENKNSQKTVTEKESSLQIEDYIAENESRLEKILTAVQGAGRVKVMITVSEKSEKVVATDKKSQTKQEVEKENSVRDSVQESTTVIYGSGTEEKPFVVKEKLPAISGVVVAATGAGDEGVKLELYEAVKALYGLSGHRIKIVKGNIKN